MLARLLAAALMVFLLAPGLAWAQRTGVECYEEGLYDDAVQLFMRELAAADGPTARRARARVYLAASLHAQGHMEEAREQLEILAREHPEERMDSVRFLPELAALADVIRQQVEAERRFAALQQEREEVLQGVSPTTRFVLRPEVFGLVEAMEGHMGGGAGVALRWKSLEGSARVLLGAPPVFHVQAGMLPDPGALRPFVGLRATLRPGHDAYGAGPVVGGRFALPRGLVGVVEVGADYFLIGRTDPQRFAITVQLGLGLNVLQW